MEATTNLPGKQRFLKNSHLWPEPSAPIAGRPRAPQGVRVTSFQPPPPPLSPLPLIHRLIRGEADFSASPVIKHRKGAFTAGGEGGGAPWLVTPWGEAEPPPQMRSSR